jgi:hypothetical protein
MKATVGAGHLSSVGALRQATELVEAELGAPTVDDAALDEVEEALQIPVDGDVPDPADVVDSLDGVGSDPTPDGRADRSDTDDAAEAIEIEIPVEDEVADDEDDASDAEADLPDEDEDSAE